LIEKGASTQAAPDARSPSKKKPGREQEKKHEPFPKKMRSQAAPCRRRKEHPDQRKKTIPREVRKGRKSKGFRLLERKSSKKKRKP